MINTPLSITQRLWREPRLVDIKGRVLAHIGSQDTRPAEDTELAYLFAASPQLVHALEDCITSDGAICFTAPHSEEYMRRRLHEISRIARAAIAMSKAPGLSNGKT